MHWVIGVFMNAVRPWTRKFKDSTTSWTHRVHYFTEFMNSPGSYTHRVHELTEVMNAEFMRPPSWTWTLRFMNSPSSCTYWVRWVTDFINWPSSGTRQVNGVPSSWIQRLRGLPDFLKSLKKKKLIGNCSLHTAKLPEFVYVLLWPPK